MTFLDRLFSTLFIDFRGEAARVLQGRSPDKSCDFIVDSFGTVILPGHLGFHSNEQTLSENAARLKDFLREKGMDAVRVVAGLGQNGVITRTVRVPGVSPRDLENMMKLEINDLLPVSPEEYAFDYKVLDQIEEDEKHYFELMVAAISRKQVEQCASLVEKAGLKPMVFDILPNMFHALFKHLENRDSLVVDGGAEGSHLAIFKGKTLFMYTDIPFVYNPLGDNDLSLLAGEMRGYLDYFASRNFGKTVDGITVLGELSRFQGLPEILGEFFAFPVSIGFDQLIPLSFKGKAAGFHEHAGVYAGNLGLMVRGSKYQAPVEIPVASGQASSGISIGA